MKKQFLISIFSLIIFGLQAQDMRFMSYNIRYDNPNDGENRWELRKAFLLKQVKFYEPDILGVQEGLKQQLDFLDQGLGSYTYVGVGRDDGKEKGEYTAIFYKKDQFNLLMEASFWLSEQPDTVSVGWDAALPRICTYALFESLASGKKFWVFNTHFDHIGEKARRKSAQLILKQIQLLNKENYPVILMGDLNLTPESKVIRIIAKTFADSRSASAFAFGPETTFNGFDFGKAPQRRIDYIFASFSNIEIKKYAILTDSQDQKYPSDHFPVYVEGELK